MRTKFSGILTLFLAFMVQLTFAQQKTVSGTVSDDQGMPLPGVNVIIKGTTAGTQTDFDGNYSLQAATGDVLVFSYVGFATQEITVGAQTNYSLSLEAGNELDEVVITGYTVIDKPKLGGSISVIESESIENVPLASFDQILQGRASGLQVSAGSGQPGRSARIRIRGNGSINGSQEPLYIVDGVPVEPGIFANFNPNDFERVDILKDANATALYGSRGANGVIVATTKKGAFSQKTVFTYNGSYGVSEAGDLKFDLMNSQQLLEFQRYINRGVGAGLTDAEIAELAQVNTDWSDVFFRTGTTNRQQLSMTGGSENTRFYSSLEYFNQEGISLRSQFDRFSFRNNIENRPSDRVKIGLNSGITFSKNRQVDSENSITLQNPFAAAYLGSPYHSLYDANGDFNTGVGFIGPNAYEHLVVSDNNTNRFKFTGNAFVEAEIIKNITGRYNLGVDYRQSNNINYTDPNTHYGRTTQPGGQGDYSETNSFFANFISNLSFNYNNKFNDVHTVDFGVYTEYLKNVTRNSAFTGYGINDLLVGYPAGITAPTAENGLFPTIGGGHAENGLFSYFGIADYDYNNRFGVNATIRRDASSKFAPENRWATFYSVAGRWNLSEEAFLENSSFVNNLKLKVSYGTSGNQDAIANFQYATSYGATTYDGQQGLAPTSIGNPDLKWEISNQFNAGIEFDLFEGSRLTGTVEYYNNITSDLFVNYNLSATSGATAINFNAGEMRNAGIDLQLSGLLVSNQDWTVELFANANYNKNEILDLGQVNEFEQGTSIIREGLSLGSHYVVGWAGVNPANGEPLYYDADGNITNVYDEDNSTANWGSFMPVYTGGFGTNISYKGLSLNTLFTFQGDYFRFNNQTFFQENPNFQQYNLSTVMLDMWKEPGDITEVQSYLYNREFTSKDIEDASFLRLRNVTLAYNFSDNIMEKIKYFDSIRIYGIAQNLKTWTKFTGFDPEDDNNIAAYEYPTPRIFTFGLDLTF